MTILLVYIGATLIISFICSLMEAVILSVPDAYVNLLEKEGRRSGRLLHNFNEHVDRPLAAILTINTLANTVGSIGIGSQVHKIYGDELLAVISGAMTFAILIFSEIIPKTLGATRSKEFARVAAYVIQAMVIITYPFVLLSRLIKDIISGDKDAVTSSREEVIAAAEIGADEGVIHQKESRIIKNLLMLDSIQVSEIMTPRSVVSAFDEDESVEAIMNKHKPVRFSRIPLFNSNFDEVTGLLHRYKLMESASNDEFTTKLQELKSPIHSVPENTPVSAALDQFIKRREHLFLVVDEYGTPSGIVTLEDAIETLLGVEIIDESDSVADMRQYALEQWRQKKQSK